MSSWIQSIKNYSKQNDIKFKIPKKGTTEYNNVLAHHKSLNSKADLKVPKPTRRKVKSVEPIPYEVEITEEVSGTDSDSDSSDLSEGVDSDEYDW